MLAAMNLESSEDGTFDEASIRGTKTLAEQIGLDPKSVNALDPAWFVYLPRDGQVVIKNELKAGGPAPGFGSPVFEFAPQLTGASISGQIAVSPSETLFIGGKQVGLKAESGEVDPASLEQVRAIVESEAKSVKGVLKAPVSGAWSVPVASVVTDASGKTCVIAKTGEAKSRTVPVKIQGSRDGRAVVDAPITPSDVIEVGVPSATRRC
jgi:hypothetical protein